MAVDWALNKDIGSKRRNLRYVSTTTPGGFTLGTLLDTYLRSGSHHYLINDEIIFTRTNSLKDLLEKLEGEWRVPAVIVSMRVVLKDTILPSEEEKMEVNNA